MIGFPADQKAIRADWQTDFLQLLPEIEQRLRQAFVRRDPATVEDAIADGVFLCVISFRRLHDRRREGAVTGANLAWFAAKQIRTGRAAEDRLNAKEPLSRYAQRRRGLHRHDLRDGEALGREWLDAMVEGSQVSILDQVATRMDFMAWLKTLTRRYRQIAMDLALGYSTSEVARTLGVTAGRISQVRRELATSWAIFQGEETVGAA